jgi:two-component system, OmpR family, response regulator
MKILVVEDDAETSAFIRSGLAAEGHTVEAVSDGREALAFCLYNPCDVVVMDRMLPGMDGLPVVRSMRSAGCKTPVLFLTAMADVDDRVEGLMAGGDDYLVKPFHFSELLARITALARRPEPSQEVTHLAVHDLEFDLLTRTVRRAGKRVHLLPKELSLLEVLMRNAGRIVTRTMLLERVWDFTFDPKTSVVETHISRLRAKVDRPFPEPLIHTTRNSGYCIRAPE